MSFFLQFCRQPPRVEVPVDGWQLLQLLHHIVKHAKSLRTRQQVLVTVEILTGYFSDQGSVLKENTITRYRYQLSQKKKLLLSSVADPDP
jgi:hypothetical protein